MKSESCPLSFIRMLADAWESEDRTISLAEALREMEDWAEQSSHKERYRNFRRFIDEVQTQLLADPEAPRSHFPALVEEIVTAIATDTWEGSAEDREAVLRLCQEIPTLKSELERIRAELEPHLQREVPLEVELKQDGETQAAVRVPPGTEGVSVPGIIPGSYTLNLSTGRKIWEGTILPNEVLWAEAYPSRDLELAAQTEETPGEPIRLETLLDGELEMRVYPGVESGTLQLTRGRSGE